MTTRRSFLKFLGAVSIAPKIAIDVLANLKPVDLIHPKNIYGKIAISSTELSEFYKHVYAPGIQDIFRKHTMTYDKFFKLHSDAARRTRR